MGVDQTTEVTGFAVSYEAAQGPTVSTDSASNIGFESAQLNGEVTDLGEESEVDAYFEYRETGEGTWNTTSTQAISSAQTYNDNISSLEDDTEYEFRAVIDDTSGTRLNEGSTLTFTTDVKTAPSIQTDPASNVNDTEAQLNGEITSIGDYDSVDVFFRWRETGAGSWNETTAQTINSAQAFDETVTGLTETTEYEFQAVAEYDSEESTGSTNTFTTEETPPAAEIQNVTSPTDGAEFNSQNIRFQFDVQFHESGDYYVDIEIDGTREFRDSVTGQSADTSISYDELIEGIELGTRDRTILVQLQEDSG